MFFFSLVNFYVSESCEGFTTIIFIFNQKDWFFIASYNEYREEYNNAEMVGSTYQFYLEKFYRHKKFHTQLM